MAPSPADEQAGKGNSADSLPDTELFVRKAMEADPKEGCGLLFQRYHATLCSHAMRFVYSRQVAEDLVSEVFLSFWHKQLYTQVTHSYRAYLFTAVRHRALNHLRNEFGRAGHAHQQPPEAVSSMLTPEQTLQYDELSRRIGQVVGALPPQMQKVFMMSRFEGMQATAIAAELQLSPRTVETHIYKALGVLRKALREEWLALLLMPFLLA